MRETIFKALRTVTWNGTSQKKANQYKPVQRHSCLYWWTTLHEHPSSAAANKVFWQNPPVHDLIFTFITAGLLVNITLHELYLVTHQPVSLKSSFK